MLYFYLILNYYGRWYKKFYLNEKKSSNLNFIITKDEEELQRKRNEENENELKEIELNIIKNKIEIENKKRVIFLNKKDSITTIEKQKQSFNIFREYIKNYFKVNLVKDKNSIGISAKKMEFFLY